MIVPEPYPVPMAPDVEQLFDALDQDLTARQREAVGTDRSAVLARVWENTAKVALIKAVSANPQAPVIRLEDADWARAGGRSLRHHDDLRGRATHRRQPDPGQPPEGLAADPGRRSAPGSAAMRSRAGPSSSSAASARISSRRWSRPVRSSWASRPPQAARRRSTGRPRLMTRLSSNVKERQLTKVRGLTL